MKREEEVKLCPEWRTEDFAINEKREQVVIEL